MNTVSEFYIYITDTGMFSHIKPQALKVTFFFFKQYITFQRNQSQYFSAIRNCVSIAHVAMSHLQVVCLSIEMFNITPK